MRQKTNIDRWLKIRERCNQDTNVSKVDWSQLPSNAWIDDSTYDLHIYYSDWNILEVQFGGSTFTISRKYVSVKRKLGKRGSVSYQIACDVMPKLNIHGDLLRDEQGNYYLHSHFGGRYVRENGRTVHKEGKIARLRLVA